MDCVRIVLISILFHRIASNSINPNIIIILADDLGWNDVGFHGSNQIPTPNLDALAFTGIILNNYYVAPICTPSRSALMTGKYPIHTGMQHGVVHGHTPYGLSLGEKIFPQFLKRAGYATRILGKWHLGSFKKEYTPEYRGFDSHYGYWTGHQDYYDHTALEKYWGYDMRRGMNVTWSDYNEYTTDLFTREATQIIKEHDKRKPLFLFLSHLATHSANIYSPLQAPPETIAKLRHIKDRQRRLFGGMLTKLDESVGSVVKALAQSNMLNNSVILFSTDNGGPAAGFNLNAASNWPLRGVKDTLWEGGVRGTAFIWSSLLPSSKVSNSMIHITDWLPTLLSLTTAPSPANDIDGMNVWENLSKGTASVRKEILLNIDEKRKVSALIYKNWKYKKGNTGTWNEWYGPSGRNMSYNWEELYNSLAAKAIKKLIHMPTKSCIMKIISDATIVCKTNEKRDATQSSTYLFNLRTDPCERQNLASKHPDIVQLMEKKLKTYIKTMVPPRNKPTDTRSNPKYWGHVWTNWMDFV